MALNTIKINKLGLSPKLAKRIDKYKTLLSALEKKEITVEVENSINDLTESINKLDLNNKKSSMEVTKFYHKALSIVEKELGYIPPKRNMVKWMIIGMTIFGVPLGVAIGAAIDNMAFLGAFIGVGLAIGVGIGANLDKKAEEEGKVLNIESM